MAQETRTHFAGLDWLRLVAALAVVGFHYFFRAGTGVEPISVPFPELAGFAIYGYLGVSLFFLISGFVIAWSAEGRRWEQFAVARVVRLYPGYVVCMTLTVLLLWLMTGPTATPLQYLANLTMFSPAFRQPFVDPVYWSIVLELVFYGWVTIALMAGVFDRWRLELIAGWLALSVFNEFFIDSGVLRMLFVTEYAAFFAAGMLVQHMTMRGKSIEALSLLFLAFLVGCKTMLNTQSWMQNLYGVSVPTLHLVLANALMYLMLIGAIRLGSVRKASTLTIAVGALTYPLYLIHQNVGYVLIARIEPILGRWAAALTAIAAMVLLAWLIWRFAERSIQPILKKLLQPIANRLSTAGRETFRKWMPVISDNTPPR